MTSKEKSTQDGDWAYLEEQPPFPHENTWPVKWLEGRSQRVPFERNFNPAGGDSVSLETLSDWLAAGLAYVCSHTSFAKNRMINFSVLGFNTVGDPVWTRSSTVWVKANDNEDWNRILCDYNILAAFSTQPNCHN